MSEWRGTNRGSSRGAERGWQSRARGRGRGTFSTNSRGTSTPFSAPSSRTVAAEVSSEKDPILTRRRMNLLASVSRSSGLEKDGDDLKNNKIQEEYRAFIQEKVDDVFKDYTRSVSETDNKKKHRVDAQENILILFRKLREGVVSSGRNDDFALEVYETSLYLAALFESPKQTISVIPHLFPPRNEPSQSKLPRHPSMYCLLISLLHQLVTSYPSQSQYYQQLDAIPKDLLPAKSEASVWLISLTQSIRTRNYTRFADLSQNSSAFKILQSTSRSDLGQKAVLSLLETLRGKVTDTTWAVIRASYREFNQTSEETSSWLARSLCLESASSWLIARTLDGHVRPKEGVEGRWIVCKIR